MGFKKILKIVSLFILTVNIAYCQTLKNDQDQIVDIESLDEKIAEVVFDDFLIDSTEEFKVVFTFKIDSLGEVHSAHIRWSKNLKQKKYYTICSKIESNFNLLFIYEKYKKEFEGEKYVYCRYPFFSKP